VEASHQYLGSPGDYTVTVCVTDDDGAKTCAALTVTVVHGFLRFCAYADDEHPGVILHHDALAHCALVPLGAPGKMRPGGVGSRGEVDVKDRAAIQGILLSLADKIDVGKDTDVSGTLTAGHDVKVDQRSQIHSSITSGHRVEVKRDAWVDGDIAAADRVKVDREQVTGGISEFASVPPIPEITWVAFSASPGTENVTVRRGDSTTLAPGVYRDLRVRIGTRLTLSPGQYVFRRFTVEKGAQLELDLSGGTIVVDVAKKLELQRDVQMAISLTPEGQPTGEPTDILFRVADGAHDDANNDEASVQLQRGGAYLGTFLAPSSNVMLGEDARLAGALYGRKVRVEQRAQITGMPARDLFASLFLTP
jgi:cytoskeletal protein CcmA (bactofilin family)